MRLFFDRNFGIRVPKALRELGMDVAWHQQYFPAKEETDGGWLSEVGKWGWVVITHDPFTPAEKERLYGAGVRCFVLDGANAPAWEKMRILSAAWPMMAYVMENEPPPYIWRLLPSGRWERG